MCKPFLAQAALRASLTMGDFTWLLRENGASRETNYLKLTHTLRFWEEARRSPAEHHQQAGENQHDSSHVREHVRGSV